MQAQSIPQNLLISLLRVEGVPLIAFLGVILALAGSGIFGICCSLVPIGLTFAGILLRCRQPERTTADFL